MAVASISANTLKLLHTLIQYNVIRMCKGDYQAFLAIYKLATKDTIASGIIPIIEDYETSITGHDVKKLKNIISRIKINTDLDTNLILMRDAFVSQGSNDYFTLKLLCHLKNHGIKLSLIMSPNTNLLIECLEQAVLTGKLPEASNDNDHNSYNNMWLLLKMKFINGDEINDLMTTFTDSLKPIYCTLSNETYEKSTYFEVYSHTPMTRAKFFALGLATDVKFDDADSHKFFESLAKINLAVRKTLIKTWTQTAYHKEKTLKNPFETSSIKMNKTV